MSEVVFDQLIYCFDRSYRDSKLFFYSFYGAWENFPKISHGTARGKISKKSYLKTILKLPGTLIFLKSQNDFKKKLKSYWVNISLAISWSNFIKIFEIWFSPWKTVGFMVLPIFFVKKIFRGWVRGLFSEGLTPITPSKNEIFHISNSLPRVLTAILSFLGRKKIKTSFLSSLFWEQLIFLSFIILFFGH